MKTLVFLGDNYPLTAGEFFVDDEMRVIASAFDKILVFTSANPSSATLNRYIPNNLEVINIDRSDLLIGKSTSILRLFSSMCKEELRFIWHKVPFLYRRKAFKVMYIDMHRAYRLKQYIIAQLAQRDIDINECVFYSYWHDYKALAIAILRQEYPMTTCIARAHRWDIYADTHHIPYLPFKKFVISNLTHTIAISEDGKHYMKQYINDKSNDNIIVSKLGKFNNNSPLMEKCNSSYIICSCSSIYVVKRLDKIIDTIANLRTQNITWIHFGDGELRQEMELYANKRLKHVRYEFKGVESNSKIMDFYAKNYVDVFINLSDSEGIPVSIMEALSAGIPVLATNVGGTSEAVNNNNGFLVDTNTNINDISIMIDTFLSSPLEQQMQKRKIAYRFWQENFEAGKNYNKFCQLLIK